MGKFKNKNKLFRNSRQEMTDHTKMETRVVSDFAPLHKRTITNYSWTRDH